MRPFGRDDGAVMVSRESPASIEKMNAVWPLASRGRRCQVITISAQMISCNPWRARRASTPRPTDLKHSPKKTKLQAGDKSVNMPYMKTTRPVSWIKATRKDFEEFPLAVQSDILSALTMVAEVAPGVAKPLKGIDGGV